MKVTEEQRRALFDRVRDHLDEETATLLLEVTVPANVDLATRMDIQELRAEMLLHFTGLDGRLTARIGELDRRITELGRRLTAQITELDRRMSGLEARIDKLATDVSNTLYRVVIPVLSGVVLVIVGISTWIGTLVG